MLSNSEPLLKDKPSTKTLPAKIQAASDQIAENQSKQTIIKISQTKTKKNKKQKQFTFILKVFNILLGVLLTAFGVYCYYSINRLEAKSFELIGYIMPGYIAFSGLIILAIEMHIGVICRNMRFLYNYFGRGLFNIYVGVMPLTLLDTTEGSKQPETQQVAIYILVCLLLFIGILYIISKIFCCAKEGDKDKKKRRSTSEKRQGSESDSSSDQ